MIHDIISNQQTVCPRITGEYPLTFERLGTFEFCEDLMRMEIGITPMANYLNKALQLILSIKRQRLEFQEKEMCGHRASNIDKIIQVGTVRLVMDLFTLLELYRIQKLLAVQKLSAVGGFEHFFFGHPVDSVRVRVRFVVMSCNLL